MCGIIGYTGDSDGVKTVLEGLQVLEYRGYDSAGVAAVCNGKVEIVKTEGRVTRLVERVGSSLAASTAIGHTRWATHGEPSAQNAHPHKVGAVTLVHNGIIENYRELSEYVLKKGKSLVSATDTEVAAAYIDVLYENSSDPFSAITEAAKAFVGSYALAILFDGRCDEIYAVRHGSPLLIGHGRDGYYLASDLTALLPFTSEYFALKEDEVAVISKNSAVILGPDGGEVTDWSVTDMSQGMAERGGHKHFMYKEMLEQPMALVGALTPRISDGLPWLGADGIPESVYRDCGEIHIVACGSAMYAGLVGKAVIERNAGIPTSVFVASEYRYFPPIARKNALVIVISQSGETADTLAALRYAKQAGYRTLAIVNTVDSSIAREAEHRIYTYAGPEIAVATTKGYTTQLGILWLFGIAAGVSRGKISSESARKAVGTLISDAPRAIKAMLKDDSAIAAISQRLADCPSVFYIGRGIDGYVCMEAALKLKEISYIHAEAYAAGELKHGTIALIDKGTPVIVLATEPDVYGKIESNIREVKARGAYVVLISSLEGVKSISGADETLTIPSTTAPGRILGAVAAVQAIAYSVACLRGCDVDKPKNLAKSVTVE